MYIFENMSCPYVGGGGGCNIDQCLGELKIYGKREAKKSENVKKRKRGKTRKKLTQLRKRTGKGKSKRNAKGGSRSNKGKYHYFSFRIRKEDMVFGVLD